jgi:hypothetical protein
VLHKLYGNLDPISLNEVLADDFIMLEKELEQGSKRKYGKQGTVQLPCAPAAPPLIVAAFVSYLLVARVSMAPPVNPCLDAACISLRAGQAPGT